MLDMDLIFSGSMSSCLLPQIAPRYRVYLQNKCDFVVLRYKFSWDQEVLGLRRLWARALVPGLNHFGSVLETVCAFYGAMQWFGERSPDGMLAQVGCSWVPLVEGRTASRCAAVLCAGL